MVSSPRYTNSSIGDVSQDQNDAAVAHEAGFHELVGDVPGIALPPVDLVGRHHGAGGRPAEETGDGLGSQEGPACGPVPCRGCTRPRTRSGRAPRLPSPRGPARGSSPRPGAATSRRRRRGSGRDRRRRRAAPADERGLERRPELPPPDEHEPRRPPLRGSRPPPRGLRGGRSPEQRFRHQAGVLLPGERHEARSHKADRREREREDPEAGVRQPQQPARPRKRRRSATPRTRRAGRRRPRGRPPDGMEEGSALACRRSARTRGDRAPPTRGALPPLASFSAWPRSAGRHRRGGQEQAPGKKSPGMRDEVVPGRLLVGPGRHGPPHVLLEEHRLAVDLPALEERGDEPGEHDGRRQRDPQIQVFLAAGAPLPSTSRKATAARHGIRIATGPFVSVPSPIPA